MTHTLCSRGCTHEDRLLAGTYVRTCEVHGTLHRVCGNCEGPLIQDHDAHAEAYDDHLDFIAWNDWSTFQSLDPDAHVFALYRHLDIQPASYGSAKSFLYDRDCLIEMQRNQS